MTFRAGIRRISASVLIAAVALWGGVAAVTAQGIEDSAPSGTQSVTPLCTLKRLHFTFTDPKNPDKTRRVGEQYLPTDDGTHPRDGLKAVAPATPQHKQQHFLGWYYADSGGNPTAVAFDPDKPQAQVDNQTADYTTEVPVVAKYGDTIPVVFHNREGGGDIIEGALRVPRGESVEGGEGDAKRVAPHAKATASGRYLAGWGKQPTGEDMVDLTKTVVNEPLDLYARFIDGRTVSFDTAGGSFVPVRVIANNGQLDPAKVQTPKRQGYEFKYWSLSAPGEEQGEFHKADTPQGDKGFTLHAVWQPVEVPYALVYMREVLPTKIPGQDYEPQYVVDSVDTGHALTDSDAPAVEKTITDHAVNATQKPYNYVFNKTRTDKEKVVVKGDGTSVKYVYYDRPRVTLTYNLQLSPNDLNNGNPYPGGGANAPGNRTVTQSYIVIAGYPTAEYRKQFMTEYTKQVNQSPQAVQAWRSRGVNPDDPHDVLFQTDTRTYSFFTYPPRVAGKNLTLYGKYIGNTAIAYDYVEVDPNSPGPKYQPGGTWDTHVPLQGAAVLNKYDKTNSTWLPLKANEFWPGEYRFHAVDQVTPTSEDIIGIPGFTAFDTEGSYDSNHSPSNSALKEPQQNGTSLLHFLIRYRRNKYPLDLRANGGDGGDQKFDVFYHDPLSGKLPYEIDKTTRSSDQAVFKGWYRDSNFVGEPVDALKEVMPDHGLVFYAKWQVPKVIVKYHEWNQRNPKAGEVFYTEEHDRGTTLEQLHAPGQVEGINASEFQGWRRFNRNGYLITVNPGIRLVKPVYDLYPAWPLQEVKLVYHKGEGSGSVPDTSANHYRPYRNGIIGVAPGLVAPSGKVLLGWKVRGAQDERVYKPGDLFVLSPVTDNDAINLDPVFGSKPTSATITYHPNGGKEEAVTITYPAWGREDFKHHARPTFTRDSYEFRGWGFQGTPANAPEITCQSALYLPPGHSDLYALWNVSNVTITIKKVDADGHALKGAQFALYRDRDLKQKVDIPVMSEGDGSFSAVKLPTSSEESNSQTYWLGETQAPAGYELMPVPVGFTLKKVPTIHMDLVEPDAVPNVTLDGTTMTIKDVPAGHLPASGGFGHLPYYLAGLVLLGAAAEATRRKHRPTTRA